MYSYGTVFESTAIYFCDPGYALNGSDARYCQANGEWNGTEPACRSEICTYIYIISNNWYFILYIYLIQYVDQNIHLCNSCGLWYS